MIQLYPSHHHRDAKSSKRSKSRSRSKSAIRKFGERSRSKPASRDKKDADKKTDAVANLGDGNVIANGKLEEKSPVENVRDKKSVSSAVLSTLYYALFRAHFLTTACPVEVRQECQHQVRLVQGCPELIKALQ